jgi:nitric oxide reductase NorD protein
MSSSPPCSESLPRLALEERLEEQLNPVLSSRRTAASLAAALASLGGEQQSFVLHWVAVVAKCNAELAYQFAALAPQALALLGPEGTQEWLIGAMDVYDKWGLYPASATLKALPSFVERYRNRERSVKLEEVGSVLELFLCGLSGRRLRVAAAEIATTDTETIYLPPVLARFPTRAQNFQLYKAIAAHLWAQTRFGTFNLPRQAYPAEEHALKLLNVLEAIRLGACIARNLPGLGRLLEALRAHQPLAPVPGLDRLAAPQATVADSLALLARVHHLEDPGWCYLGQLQPERALAVREARLPRERQALQRALARLACEQPSAGSSTESLAPFRWSVRIENQGMKFNARVELDGRPVNPPPEVHSLIQSIVQDLGELPPEYLVAAGDAGTLGGGLQRVDPVEQMPQSTQADKADKVYLYDEWDFRRRHYRREWCTLRERDVHPATPEFARATLNKYRYQVAQLRRLFEALRQEPRRLRKEPFGDDVDIDALVESLIDLRQGMELPARLFVEHRRTDRHLAALFVVDMSGSTKGWINDAEREALVMLCQALEALGDRYAIYGFSGITRKRCEFHRVKRFDEPYGEAVESRIGGIIPLDYTRMGPALRHAARLLGAVEARTKLLITLSDGRPDDYGDEYRGEYGIEDTRQALLEAKRLGIHPYCITIDREARDYLPRMYGEVSYTVVDDPGKLPFKVADIYRRLTF